MSDHRKWDLNQNWRNKQPWWRLRVCNSLRKEAVNCKLKVIWCHEIRMCVGGRGAFFIGGGGGQKRCKNMNSTEFSGSKLRSSTTFLTNGMETMTHIVHIEKYLENLSRKRIETVDHRIISIDFMDYIWQWFLNSELLKSQNSNAIKVLQESESSSLKHPIPLRT